MGRAGSVHEAGGDRGVFVGDGHPAGGWPGSCALPIPPPGARSPAGEQESIFQASA